MSERRLTQSQRRQSLADPNYRGNDYAIDTMIRTGPMGNRKCTDCVCLLIFLASCAGMTMIGLYANEHGDPSRILRPIDSDGNFCGASVGYEDYPLMWY
jgi:hypothetical protein